MFNELVRLLIFNFFYFFLSDLNFLILNYMVIYLLEINIPFDYEKQSF